MLKHLSRKERKTSDRMFRNALGEEVHNFLVLVF